MHDGAVKHRKAARQMTAFGTFPTCRSGLTMSVHRGQTGSGRTTVETTRLTQAETELGEPFRTEPHFIDDGYRQYTSRIFDALAHHCDFLSLPITCAIFAMSAMSE
jgi:hypothetical protein